MWQHARMTALEIKLRQSELPNEILSSIYYEALQMIVSGYFVLH